jgi:hypothetical protein
MVTNDLKTENYFQSDCIYGLQGLADFLGVCKKTAWNIKKENKVPYYQIKGTLKIYFKKSEVIDAMASSNINKKQI